MGPIRIIVFIFWVHRITQNKIIWPRALSRCFLNSCRSEQWLLPWEPLPVPDHPLSEEMISNLTLSWRSFLEFPQVLLLSSEKRSVLPLNLIGKPFVLWPKYMHSTWDEAAPVQHRAGILNENIYIYFTAIIFIG